jgi:hypothetical protein
MSSSRTTHTRLPGTSLLPSPGSAEGCGHGGSTDEHDRGQSTSENVDRLSDGVPSRPAAHPLTLGKDGPRVGDVDADVASQLLGHGRSRNPLDGLTEPEHQVLALMAEGERTRPCVATHPRAHDRAPRGRGLPLRVFPEPAEAPQPMRIQGATEGTPPLLTMKSM